MANTKIVKTRQFFEEGFVEHLADVPSGGNPRDDGREMTIIGKPEKRADAYDKVSGGAVYTFDVKLPQIVYARTLRCPLPHAKIRSIDPGPALAMKGVYDVITFENVPDIPWYHDSKLFDPHLRYAGDEVACIAAVDEETANRALRAIKVDYETLPFVLDPRKAAQKSSEPFHEEGRFSYGNPWVYERGDVDAGFADAAAVVEGDFDTQVAVHNPTEPHGSVVTWQGDRLTIYDSTQYVYGIRDTVADALHMPQSHIKVLTPVMGGGFGSKLEAGKYTVMAALLARRIGRPVKIRMDREEMNLAMGNRPDSYQHLKVGAKADGTLTAMTSKTFGSSGAYRASAFVNWPFMTLYKCPNLRSDQSSVFTNLGRARPFRAPGHPQGTFALDSILDELADKLGIDPLELRIRNMIEYDQFTNKPYTSKKLLEAYHAGAEAIGWSKRKPNGSDSGPIKRGFGLATQIWGGGGGPPAGVTVKLNSDGSVRAIAGSQDLGTGTYTFVAQVVAEALEVDPAKVEVTLGDTSTGPYCPASGGSQTAPSVAPAAWDAALQVKDALLDGAAAILDVPKESLVYEQAAIYPKDTPAKKLSLAQVVSEMGEQTLVRTGYREANDSSKQINSFGAQFAEVEVDTVTGKVRVLRIVAAHDIGRPLNRRLLENQFEGGIIQGMSLALFEERVVDDYTGKVLTTNLHDYKVPTVEDIPEIEVIIVPNDHDTDANNLSVKGIGEPPIIPTAGAIANAVANALGMRIRSLPITPDKILNSLAAK